MVVAFKMDKKITNKLFVTTEPGLRAASSAVPLKRPTKALSTLDIRGPVKYIPGAGSPNVSIADFEKPDFGAVSNVGALELLALLRSMSSSDACIPR